MLDLFCTPNRRDRHLTSPIRLSTGEVFILVNIYAMKNKLENCTWLFIVTFHHYRDKINTVWEKFWVHIDTEKWMTYNNFRWFKALTKEQFDEGEFQYEDYDFSCSWFIREDWTYPRQFAYCDIVTWNIKLLEDIVTQISREHKLNISIKAFHLYMKDNDDTDHWEYFMKIHNWEVIEKKLKRWYGFCSEECWSFFNKDNSYSRDECLDCAIREALRAIRVRWISIKEEWILSILPLPKLIKAYKKVKSYLPLSDDAIFNCLIKLKNENTLPKL